MHSILASWEYTDQCVHGQCAHDVCMGLEERAVPAKAQDTCWGASDCVWPRVVCIPRGPSCYLWAQPSALLGIAEKHRRSLHEGAGSSGLQCVLQSVA